MIDKLDWATDGRDWPHREASRFVTVGNLVWHVQLIGQGPALLLLHGTGASTHSWAPIVPYLAQHFLLVIPDLPGHAFSGTPDGDGLTLPGMARHLSGLLTTLGLAPTLVAGHSAGAAVAVRMALDELIAPKSILAVNGALLPLGGFAGPLFSPLANLLVLNPFVPRIFAWRAGNREAVRKLLEGTGSRVSESSLTFYARLFQCLAHVKGTLSMMAGWDLTALEVDMVRLPCHLHLLAASQDTAITPAEADRVRRRIPMASVRRLEGLGHLAHEERPDLIAKEIEALASKID